MNVLRTTHPAIKDADVLLWLEEGATGADLVSALRDIGVPDGQLDVDGRSVGAAGTLEEQQLVAGSVLGRDTNTPTLPQPVVGTHLVVLAGPEAGRWITLSPGVVTVVGRTAGSLRLAKDLVMSRVHLEFTPDGMSWVVRDLASANGTFVEGERIDGPTALSPGEYVYAGSSVLTVLRIEPEDLARIGAASAGTYPFPRTFRAALASLPTDVRTPSALPEEHGQADSWWRALLPLITGIGFAIITKNFLFLLISALAPLVYAVDAVRKKRTTRQRRQRTASTHATESALARDRFVAAALEERNRARNASMSGGIASVYAGARHRRLWERRPEDADFLSLTLGLAATNSVVGLNAGHDDEREHHRLWGMPIDVNLVETGSLAVVGEVSRGRAVVRALLMGLAVSHSPGEVCVWVLSPDNAVGEWRALRWLPHLADEGGVSRIATAPDQRSAMVASIRQLMDSRREQRPLDHNLARLPVHVVVVDSPSLLPAADVSELLVRGPQVGVYGVVIDGSVAPEGTMATLQIGVAADEAVFESRISPRVGNLLTAEMPADAVEPAARRLAALRPAAAGRSQIVAKSERLAHLLRSDAVGASRLATNWKVNGPTTRVPVGTVADSTFFVDIVRDGPHGMVGGMTRSGKTEFLKTLISSLAWNNHPDDLTFVIVDFKGGIDYNLAKHLPHVLEVSSNQNLAGFERTLRLLVAEQVRRQRLFDRLQVANLDSYRAKVTSQSHGAVPRLVVLVDEFGELQSTDIGKEQMKRLESVARIGGALGINLLLITQKFDHGLPAQIAANSGLRICFKVQSSADSKIVLDTGIAESIPAAAKGRAYARLMGADPIEFQSMRVAGQRPELRGGSPRVRAQLQPATLLPVGVADEVAGDVPGEDSDMWAIITRIKQAAAAAGWTAPAVPWPDSLPTDVPLESLIGRGSVDEVVIGLADLPDQQRQVPWAVRAADEHVALLGGPRADLGTLITTMACSAAARRPPSELHLYGIDFAGRGLARLAALPHCGGVASRNEPLAVRIVRHLNDEAARRRSAMSVAGVTSLAELHSRTGQTFPHVMLFVIGGERLTAAGGEDQSEASAPMTRLLSDAVGLGIQVIATGTPGFASYRPGTLIDRRIAFETVDVGDYVQLGCPRPMLAEIRGPRRGVDLTARTVVQFASLAAGEVNEADVFDAVAQRITESWPVEGAIHLPHRIREVGWPLHIGELADHVTGRKTVDHTLMLGIDEAGEPVTIDMRDIEGPLFIAGGRRSGRSTSALAVGILAMHIGWNVVAVGFSAASPIRRGEYFDCVDADRLDTWLAGADGSRLVILDDVHQLNETYESALLRTAEGVVVTGTASFIDGTQRRLTDCGVARAVNGVVLMPRDFSDISIIGARSGQVRLGASAGRRPGQGLCGINGDLMELTMPFVDGRLSSTRGMGPA